MLSNHLDEKLKSKLKDEIIGSYDANVQIQFLEAYANELEDFLREMTLAFSKWKELDRVVTKDQNTMIVSAYTYGSLQHHLISMKLLVSGYFVPSGNAQRYVLEYIATAILAASEPRLRTMILEGKYTSTNSVRHLLKKSDHLNLDREAVERIRKGIKYYDQLSHPSLLALGSASVALDSNQLILGVHFDEGKRKAYDFEVASRVGIASILTNFLVAVQQVYVP